MKDHCCSYNFNQNTPFIGSDMEIMLMSTDMLRKKQIHTLI